MMTEMTAETVTEIDDDITLADGKRTLTNSSSSRWPAMRKTACA